MKSMLTGGYPRPVELIQAIKKKEKGEMSREKLEALYLALTKQVIEEQKKAGLDYLTDGCLRWDDIVTFFAQGLGLELDGLERFFDNNFYFRRPLVKGKIEWKEPVLTPHFPKDQGVVPVCPGPYTLSQHMLNEHYSDTSELVNDLAVAVNSELKALSEAGAEIIQIDEPSLCMIKDNDTWNLAKDALDKALEGVNAKTMVSLYFLPIKDIYPQMLDIKADILGIDFVSADNRSVIDGSDFTKELGFGIMDARNTKIDEGLKKEIEWAKEITDSIYVKPNFGFDLLPHEPVLKKLEALARSVKE